MPIPFTCPHCESHTLVDDEYGGLSGPCHACGRQISVPHASTVASVQTVSPTVTYAGPATATNTQPQRMSTRTLVAGYVLAALAALFVLSLGFYMVGGQISNLVAGSRKTQCKSRLLQIYAAMEMYHDEHGCYPPAVVNDKAGRPRHSWRVLLLPYMGQEHADIYQRYDFNQDYNQTALAWQMAGSAKLYRCPSNEDMTDDYTNYMVVTGPNTLFPGAKSRSKDDIKDNLATTIMVVEVVDSHVTWLQPVDFDVSISPLELTDPDGGGLSSHHAGAHVLTADGKVHYIDATTRKEFLEAMCTIAGGEPLPEDIFGDH